MAVVLGRCRSGCWEGVEVASLIIWKARVMMVRARAGTVAYEGKQEPF